MRSFVLLFALCICSTVFADGRIFEESITVTGRALDADGKPIAGAQIYLASVRHGQKLIGETVTDAKGEYAFTDAFLPVKQPEQAGFRTSGVFEVFGQAEGFGFAWRSQKWFYPDGAPDFGEPEDPGNPRAFSGGEPIVQDLRFDKPAPLSGFVVDENGKPIPNASVILHDAEPVPKSGYSNADELAIVQDNAFTALYLSRVIPGEMRLRITNDEGRFSFDQAPANSNFRIYIHPPGFAKRAIYASTAAKDKFPFNDMKVYFDGMRLEFVSVKQCNIRVVYGDSNKPAPNVRISLSNTSASQQAISDANGHATVRLPPGKYRAGYLTANGTDYISRYSTEAILSHTIPKDDKESDLTIRLEPAGVAEVEIVDAHVGRPIEGVDVSVHGGGFHGAYHWRNWKMPNISAADRPRTDTNGKLKLLLIPGTYTIGPGYSHTPAKYSSGSGTSVSVKSGETIELKLKMKRARVR